MTTLFDTRQVQHYAQLAQLTSGTFTSLKTILTTIDSQMSKLYEDRNILLADGGTLTYTSGSPSVLALSATLKLHVNGLAAGGSPKVITITGTSFNFTSNGAMLYAVIDRSAGTATVTSDSLTLPTVNNSNLEVVLIAKRVDGANQRVYFRNGQSLGNGESTVLGNTSSSFNDNFFNIFNNSDNTKIIKFSLSNITTGTTRTYSLPDANSTLLGNTATQSVSNKTLDNTNVIAVLTPNLTIQDNSDTTKSFRFVASSITTATQRNFTLPDANTTLVGTDAIQTLTNKTLQQDIVSGYLDYSQTTSPATPSAGVSRLYSKSDGKFYRKDPAGNEYEIGSGGTGELNVVLNPNDANTGWTASGAGITVATSSTSTDLPIGGIAATSIKITPVSGTTDYVYYRFTMPTTFKNRKLKIQWEQLPLSGYATGDLKVQMFKNSASNYTGSYTQFSLSTDNSGVTSIPAFNGRYTTTFDTDSGDFYELRIARVAGTTALNLANVIIGPGVQPNSAIVSAWQSLPLLISATTTAPTPGTNTSVYYYRRIGDSLEYRFEFNQTVAGSAGSGTYLINLPTGLTYDSSKTVLSGSTDGHAGDCNLVVNGTRFDGHAFMQNSTQIGFWLLGETGTPNSWGTTGFGSISTSQIRMAAWGSIPIAEWQSTGNTINTAFNDVEYAYNDGSSTTANDSTSFRYGPGGASILPFTSNTTGLISRRVRFMTPISPTDKITVEVARNLGGPLIWVDVGSAGLGGISANTVKYGIAVDYSTTNFTDIDITFGKGGASASAVASYGGTNGDPWSGYSQWLWRAKKASGGAAVGFGLASTTQSGLLKYYEEFSYSQHFTFDGTGGGGDTQTLSFVRSGNKVTMLIPALVSTTGTGSTEFKSDAPMPARFKPPYELGFVVGVKQAGTALTTPGRLRIEADGSISVRKDIAGNAWTNGQAGSGLAAATSVSWNIS